MDSKLKTTELGIMPGAVNYDAAERDIAKQNVAEPDSPGIVTSKILLGSGFTICVV